ncbi:hypothetical protein EG68_09527 [Paragonimus skrjabini miyazakii]|uniref:LEM domain-containing protein n=1 Tax=Paragonimus skrjabini miyazakii TaxID=59628 RepID=A0A8S9YKG1_9TREM|nr:hypothetical protein EG68_09527 [Paragonimus skrjabini miyazakii]
MSLSLFDCNFTFFCIFLAMQTEVTDDELRALLSKYMEVVPPVTDTTRQVLLAKLEKYLISDLPPENVGDKNIENLLGTSVTRSPKRSPKVDLPSTNAVKALSPENSQKSTVDTDHGVLRINSPNLKLSPSALDYATRLPIYRRRSIHPDHPGLASPYSDLVLPTSPYKNRFPFQQNSEQLASSGSQKTSWFHGPLACVFELFAAFVGLLCALGSVFSRIPIPGKTTSRYIFWLLVVILLVFAAAHFLLGDPFYHNPVNELRNLLQI